MDILNVLITFAFCWILIEITLFLSNKLTTTNNIQFSYQSFIWSLRIVACLLFGGLIIIMNQVNNFDLNSFISICHI